MKKKIILITIISIIVDRISKILIVNNFGLYDRNYIIDNFFYLTYVKNDGAAWSILSGKQYLLIFITFLALFFIIKTIIMEKSLKFHEIISYGLLLGGIFGNLIDRILYSYVIDFLGIIIFKYNFPVFNIADTFIVIGVIIMAISVLRGDFNEDNS